MEKYSIGISESHVIAIMNGKRVLISTGAPISIGDTPEIMILGQAHKIENKYLDLDIKQISEHLRTDLNALLGLDVLSKFIFYVSHGIEAMICSDFFINFKETMRELPISIDSGQLMIDVKIGGVPIKMILDTGARLSFLNSILLEGQKSFGKKEVFYPGAGVFTTKVYNMPLELKEKVMAIPVGKLPDNMMTDLSLRQCSGLLGAEVFKYFSIQFCLKKNTIWMVEKGQTR
ncbi:MAG: hypothetical protein HY920_02835 [Elusimicrobia bacterium]|nr:hypothetical protein [Elusimicrobiota bacterium]